MTDRHGIADPAAEHPNPSSSPVDDESGTRDAAELTFESTQDSADLQVVLDGLRATHLTGRTHDHSWRREQLRGLMRFLRDREADIAKALQKDLGRTAFESWLGDIAPPMSEARHALRNLGKWARPRRRAVPVAQMPARARIQYEPLGAVLIIGAWNYPINLTLSPMVAAFAAGNCIVLKPSELAPACSRLLASELPRYLDSTACAVIEGDGRTTQELLGLGFDHAFFTGGSAVGKKVMEGAAHSLTPVTLELGGKSPAIVTRTANLQVAARRIAWVKLMNSGQTCIAPDYVLVDQEVKDEFVTHLRAAIEFQSAGQGGLKPIVNRRQFDRLRGHLEHSTGQVVVGGVVDELNLRIAPTVLLDPAATEPSMTEEIFGPILPVHGFDEVDDAIDFVRKRPKPLGLYVFTQDRRLARRLVSAIPAGGAVVNHCALQFLMPSLPFGGVGASGMGAYHGEWGFQTFSHRKAIATKGSWPDPAFMYPPYGALATKLMRKLL